jgi:hypothetical protein
VRGLINSADGHLIKPFLLPEQMARMQALIRRSQSAGSSRLVAGPLTLDIATHMAPLHGEPRGQGDHRQRDRDRRVTPAHQAGVRQAVDPHGARPKKAVPGGVMKYDGLPDAKARADLIEHLATVK